MATSRITKKSVDASVPGEGDLYLWDEELRGFGVKITPAGRKVYLVQYRLGGRSGKTRRVTIGTHGNITTDQARAEAKRILGKVAIGEDPAAERRQQKQRKTLGELLEAFVMEHVEAKLKASTATEYKRVVSLHISAGLKRSFVDEIQRSDVTRLHTSLRDRPYQANRTLAFLSKFFNWCEQHGHRTDGSNPCRHVQKYKERKRDRFLSLEELSRLGDALAEAEEKQLTSPHVIAAIRLLALTGARLSEILTLKWSYVDLDARLLRLPDSKTGQKVIYLSDAAIETLSEVPRLAGNPFVICGKVEGARLVNLQKPWRRIRKMAGLDDVRIHDARHSFASVAAASGQSLPVIGALLGHSQPQTTARYAHLAADPVRQANNVTADAIAKAMAAGRIPTNKS